MSEYKIVVRDADTQEPLAFAYAIGNGTPQNVSDAMHQEFMKRRAEFPSVRAVQVDVYVADPETACGSDPPTQRKAEA